jgi:peptide subunit release factor RF-3
LIRSEVFRLCDEAILTFINKLDREAHEPFDLLDEIEQSLALDVTLAFWPIGMRPELLDTCDRLADEFLCSSAASMSGSVHCSPENLGDLCEVLHTDRQLGKCIAQLCKKLNDRGLNHVESSGYCCRGYVRYAVCMLALRVL